MKFPQFVRAWLPAVLWMALMFTFSTDLLSAEHTSRILTPLLLWLDPHISLRNIARVHFLVRKSAHLTEYAILAGLLFRAQAGAASGFWRRAGFAWVPAVLFAITDEFHQRFVPSRTASLGDVVIDSSGALIGIFICAAISLAWRNPSAPVENSRASISEPR